MKTKILTPTKENILKVLKCLKEEQAVVCPTETVYGLVADAFSENAIESVFKVKQRDKEKPLSCNIGDLDMLYRLTSFSSLLFKRLTEMFWPGPLTIVVEKLPTVLDLVTAKKKTVAIRFSSNLILKELTNLFGGPLVVPSANISCMKSFVNAYDVYNELCGRIKYIIDGGECEFKKESTIISVEGENFEILREGVIKKEEIECL